VIADQPPTVEVVVVRSTNLPPSPSEAAYSIIRLDSARLAAAARLDDALAAVPGFSLFRRTPSLGANPTTQGVSLRGIAGSGASRALVTLDGVPQNDPFGGWVIWTRLPTADIGGATVVRGAGAGPYGAGALTGVVALTEIDPRPGDWTLDAEGGSLGYGGGAATADLAVGPGSLLITASGSHSDGWIPVIAGRGAADQPLTLSDESVSVRYQLDAGRAAEAWRASVYQEERGSGLAGANSRARGASLSFSAATPPAAGALGWRAQAWLLATDLANTSVSVSANRQTATLSNNEYATPTLGYGVNGAIRGAWRATTLEAGVDLRGVAGEDHEDFHAGAPGVLTENRDAGGQTFTGGAYADVSSDFGALRLTAGGRVDGWDTFGGHRFEHVIATSQSILNLNYPDRGGVLPSGRAGARWSVGDGQWLRAAAYTGFRAPTLNELFRPFRVGNNITEANPSLTPERLYGVEAGAGGAFARATWSATVFYNWLENPVTNVTLHKGPYTDPVEGFIPSGGLLIQRQNVGAVRAYGLEAEAAANLLPTLKADAAVSWTHARVDGGASAPQLTGLMPSETPDLIVTGGLSWRAISRLTLSADARYQGTRFADDQNTLRLAPATTVDLRAEWRAGPRLRFFVAADNIADIDVATDETAGGVYSYGPPRTVRAGFIISGGGPR
jgi:outer membrane receptor protein involved in Fe transport